MDGEVLSGTQACTSNSETKNPQTCQQEMLWNWEITAQFKGKVNKEPEKAAAPETMMQAITSASCFGQTYDLLNINNFCISLRKQTNKY